MLDYRIETFITLCRERNYSKTAQKLCITQPAVTQHIQYLERYYNCKLFKYENKQLKLTEQGMLLERMALGLNASSKRLKTMIQELDKKQKTFNAGCSITISEFMMAPIVTSLLKKDPELNLNIHVDSGKSLIAGLKNGTLDCAFIEGEINHPELRTHTFLTGEYVLVSATKFENPTIDDLLSQTLITREHNSSCYDLLEKGLSKYNKSISDFSNSVHTNDIHLIKKLVLDGLGIGLLYKDSIKQELEDGRLHEFPMNFGFNQTFHIAMLKDTIFNEAYDRLFKFLIELYENYNLT